MRLTRLLFALGLAGVASVPVRAQTNPPAGDVRRLYDSAPVSATNPVLATVKECGIVIPASEFRAFAHQNTPPGSEGKQLSLEEKRRELQKLLDDHFFLWEGFAKKADQTDDIRELLRITETEATRAMLIEQEIGPKATTFEIYKKLSKELRQRIFDKVDIHVSVKAHETLKAAAKRVDEADRKAAKASRTNHVETPAAPDGLTEDERNLPLATCKVATIRVGHLLPAYRQLPVEERPNLGKREVLEQLLQEILEDELMLAEARERGLHRAPMVLDQVEADRNGLVRQWALSEVARKADAAMNEPGLEMRLRKWYESHLKSDYTVKDENGKERVLDFDADRDLIQGDYFNDLHERMRTEEIRKLREGRKIQVDETLLEQLTVAWWARPARTDLGPPLANWDAVTREYVVKAGETNTSFSFTVTNVSPVELVIEDIHPANQFVTVNTPPLPWQLNPGEHGKISLAVDLRNKVGVGESPIHVVANLGSKTLTLKITYPGKPAAEINRAEDGKSK